MAVICDHPDGRVPAVAEWICSRYYCSSEFSRRGASERLQRTSQVISSETDDAGLVHARPTGRQGPCSAQASCKRDAQCTALCAALIWELQRVNQRPFPAHPGHC